MNLLKIIVKELLRKKRIEDTVIYTEDGYHKLEVPKGIFINTKV
jgi:hypothetical protein